jgi:hypothetical protein
MRSRLTSALFLLVGSGALLSVACGSDAGTDLPGAGGVFGSGGQVGAGGQVAAGGASSSGGFVGSTGATQGTTGGFTGSTGGLPGTTGGAPATGGGVSSGGTPASGGAGTGGGSDGGSPATGGGGAGTGGAPVTGATKPPCLKDPKQIIQIGDSYMNWPSHTFPADMNAAFGQTLRPTYAVGGYSMATGGIGLIPPEFDQAVTADPNIIAVIMDGGGNDVLIPSVGRPDCKNMANAGTIAGCQAIVTDALAAADKLMTKMVAAKVHDAVYFFYPHVPQPTALGGSNPNAMLDYGLPRVKAFCDGIAGKTSGAASCWFVDLVPVFTGHDDWFAAGDIHENSTGSKAIAKAINDTMKAHCIGQPASSGCCAP